MSVSDRAFPLISFCYNLNKTMGKEGSNTLIISSCLYSDTQYRAHATTSLISFFRSLTCDLTKSRKSTTKNKSCHQNIKCCSAKTPGRFKSIHFIEICGETNRSVGHRWSREHLEQDSCDHHFIKKNHHESMNAVLNEALKAMRQATTSFPS